MSTSADIAQAISAHPRGSLLSLMVKPRSSRNQLDLQSDGTVRARITAPPAEGAANDALLRFLADTLAVSRSRLSIASGERGRRKRILVEGMPVHELASRLVPRL